MQLNLMNPIHEQGLASLVFLFMVSTPAALSALVGLILSQKRPRGAAIAANVTIVIASLVCLMAAITTQKLHSRIDDWIDTGGYGPPAQVRSQYAADWHASARLTAWAGLVFSTLPYFFAVIVHAIARQKEKGSRFPIFATGLAVVSLLFCAAMAIL